MSRSITAARRTARLLVVLVTSFAAMASTAFAFADGIDVSHWQGQVSWSKVGDAGITFAFMKATEGGSYTDPTLQTNWEGARAAGIYRGAYHFARPSTGTAVSQATFFVSKVGSFRDAGVLPPVLDLESRGSMTVSGLQDWTSTWLQTVEELTGRTPIIYVSPSFWETYLGNSRAFTRYPLWIAHYGVTTPRVPGGWSTWTFWQRTSTGRVSGIYGDVDMNRFNGTSAQLAVLANATGGSSSPAPSGPTVPPVPTGPTGPTVAATALTMVPATVTPGINEPVTFEGDLTQATDSAGVASAPLALWARTAGTTAWTKVLDTVTDAHGHYAVTTRVPRSADYRTTYGGDATHTSTAATAVRVTTPPRTVVTADLHKDRSTTVSPGTKVMIYGHLTTPTGPLTGKYVRFYRRPAAGGAWTYIRRTPSLSPTGWYSTNVYPQRSTTYKVVSYGTLFLAPATSTQVTVSVR